MHSTVHRKRLSGVEASPGREHYLLHSIERSGVRCSIGQVPHGGIHVKSHFYITESRDVFKNGSVIIEAEYPDDALVDP
jgi:hypothetical protein